MRKIFYISS